MTATSTELLAGTETVHPYYRLLPSYITTESVQAERQDFLSRIQETLECLQSLRGGEALDSVLQNRHFRDVDTLFKLKHELPVQLHVQLIRVLVELVWTRDGRCFTDVDMEIRAVKTLHLLLKKWKKRQRDQEVALAGDLVIDWRSVKRAIERVCFRAPGCIQQASQSYLAKLTNTTTKCAEVARSFFQATDPAVPLVMELWTEFGVSIKDVKTTECFRALAFFSFLLSLPSFEGTETEKDVVALLPEWFSVWSLISRCSEWDGHWMKILSRVAKRYPSTSMLDEYLPFIFAKVHDLLELPSDLGSPFKKQLWPSAYTSINGSKRFSQHVMRLCVYLLRDAKDDDRNGTPNQYLFEILSLMKSFFHPSNVANVGNSLATFVYYLSNALSKRLGSEKKNEKGLSAISVCKIVDAILGICLLGIYSKNRGVATKCMYVMKDILCIDPTRCAAPVMEEMLKALDPMAMSHSHLAVTAISSMAVLNLLAILYVQMSPEIYTQCLRKTVAFVSRKVISTLIFNCMQGNPSEAIARFMPLVLENFHATKTSIDVVGLMTNEKVWYLQILNGLVRFSHQDDRILLRYQPELKLILAQFLSSDDVKDVYEAAGAVLRHLLSGLVGVYTHDFRSLPAAEWVDATSPNSGAFQYMGIGISQNKLSVKWHEPNEAELSFGFNLLQDHVVGALDELERMRQAKNLNALFQGLCGAANVLTDDSVTEEEGKGEHVLALSRNELVEKAMFFYAKRKVQQHFAVASAIMKPESDNETRQRYETLLMDLEWLLTNPYEDVRSNAAGVMKECSVLYARWVYFRQPKQIEELEGFSDAMQLKEEHVSGVLHMLSLPLARRNLWKRRDTLLKRVLLVLLKSNYAIVKQVDSEVSKVKIEWYRLFSIF
uniref:Proteasome activator Blm10 middle HEAT repeats region domain-containing protein n=1 Tax=Phytophthora ramorum TaxID=164328 RepID=H3HEF1_PHYRM